MTSVFIRRGTLVTQTDLQRECCVKSESQIGVMSLQAKEY